MEIELARAAHSSIECFDPKNQSKAPVKQDVYVSDGERDEEEVQVRKSYDAKEATRKL